MFCTHPSFRMITSVHLAICVPVMLEKWKRLKRLNLLNPWLTVRDWYCNPWNLMLQDENLQGICSTEEEWCPMPKSIIELWECIWFATTAFIFSPDYSMAEHFFTRTAKFDVKVTVRNHVDEPKVASKTIQVAQRIAGWTKITRKKRRPIIRCVHASP